MQLPFTSETNVDVNTDLSYTQESHFRCSVTFPVSLAITKHFSNIPPADRGIVLLRYRSCSTPWLSYVSFCKAGIWHLNMKENICITYLYTIKT